MVKWTQTTAGGGLEPKTITRTGRITQTLRSGAILVRPDDDPSVLVLMSKPKKGKK